MAEKRSQHQKMATHGDPDAAAAALCSLLHMDAVEPERDDDGIYRSMLEARRHGRLSSAAHEHIPVLVPRKRSGSSHTHQRAGSENNAGRDAGEQAGGEDAPSLTKSVRLLASAALARRRGVEAITARELVHAADMLVQHAANGDPAATASPDSLRINYDAFTSVRDSLGPKFATYMTATTFLKFPRDKSDQVSVKGLLRFLSYKVQLHSMWRRLSSYDSEGDGYLREHDLENHVFEAIPELPDLASLQENFHPFYVFTAVRKFFFLLDPAHSGRIRIADLIGSRVFMEWLQLWTQWPSELAEAAHGALAQVEEAERLGAKDGGSEPRAAPHAADNAALATLGGAAHLLSVCSASGDVPPSNWFSAANAVRVYSQYLNLDADQNGLLSPSELARMNAGSFTELFISRLFQEVHTYSGEMDYKAYLDFVLATEYRTAPQSMRYFFRILDARKTGGLTLFDLRMYFREVVARLVASGHDPIDVANVCDEIFDMVHPADGAQITLADLRKSRLGHTVLQILTDAAGFWQYDNREVLLQQQMQAAESDPVRDAHVAVEHEFA